MAIPYDIRSVSANRVAIGTYTTYNEEIRGITQLPFAPWLVLRQEGPPAGAFEVTFQ